jgi:hypothetical protein
MNVEGTEDGSIQAAEQANNELDEQELIDAAATIGRLSTYQTMPADIEAIVSKGFSLNRNLIDCTRDLLRSLENYFGSRSTAMWILIAITYGSSDVDGFDLLGDVEDRSARDQLEMALRRLGGLYGDDINRGFTMTRRPAEDWEYANITSRFDVETDSWLIDVELDRLDYEKARIVGDPLSVMRLVNRLLWAVSALEQYTEDFQSILSEQDVVDEFAVAAHSILSGLGILEGDELEAEVVSEAADTE